jgi:hypothetical protein
VGSPGCFPPSCHSASSPNRATSGPSRPGRGEAGGPADCRLDRTLNREDETRVGSRSLCPAPDRFAPPTGRFAPPDPLAPLTKETKCGEKDSKESQRPIVASKWGKRPSRTPWSEGGNASWSGGRNHAEGTDPPSVSPRGQWVVRGTAKPRREEPDASLTRTSGSVGALGEQSPRATRPAMFPPFDSAKGSGVSAGRVATTEGGNRLATATAC